MRINELLSAFNDGLKEQGVPNFFVANTTLQKKPLGNFYDLSITINYVRGKGDYIPFIQHTKVVQIKDGQEEEIKEKEELAILSTFLTKLLQPDIAKSIVGGTYGIK